MVKMIPRIAVGGFQHETNTFSPIPTELRHFEQPGSWPGLQRGHDIIANLAGLNVSITGAVETLQAAGAEVVGTTWCVAPPSGKVTNDAFKVITGMLCEDLARAGPLDGVVLELHGAMVTEQFDDAEREIVRRVREVVGATPIAVTLDLHANLSDAFVHEVDCMEAYQTYPHVDIAATGVRVANVLLEIMASGEPLAKAVRRLDFLIPTPWQCTDIEPSRSIYARLRSLVDGDVRILAFTPGFNAADIPMCGPVVFGYGRSAAAIEAAVDDVHAMLIDRESSFSGRLYSAKEAVVAAIVRYDGTRPVIVADGEDNPGGGGTGDTTTILHELVAQRARGAVVAAICDPDAARVAHGAGEGARISLPLGGKLDGNPFVGEFVVERLGSGRFVGTGPMYRGGTLDMGPMALLAIDGVRVIVASKASQPADQSIFRHLGLEPANQAILVLKSVVHFRNDFAALASEVIDTAASGLVPVDPRALPFRNLAPGMRLVPRTAQVGTPF
jgi:microcystin degradation protein MlrC